MNTKPPYELKPLRQAVLQHRANILAFQNAISKEEQELDECQGYIEQWEDYNRSTHGDPS